MVDVRLTFEDIAEELKRKVAELGLNDVTVTIKLLHRAVQVKISGYINLGGEK